MKSLQYQRRDSIEIHGLLGSINDGDLEKACIDILVDIGCGEISTGDIHTCHRLKKLKKHYN